MKGLGGLWEPRMMLVCLLALAGVALLPATSATAAAPSSSLTVVFNGTGTYFVHQSADGTASGGCTLDTNDTFTLNWQTRYTVALTNEAGVRTAGSATGTIVNGPGTFALSGTATGGVNCSTSVPLTCNGNLPGNAAPTMMYGAGFGQDVFSPLAFGLSSTGPPACIGQSDQSESNLVRNDLMIFANYVPPSMLTPNVQFPDSAVRAGPQKMTVSNQSTPPSDCSSLFASSYSPAVYSCSETLQWSGTVTTSVTSPCQNTEKACVDPQEKQQAMAAAAGYAAGARAAKEQYAGLGCGPGVSNYDSREVAWACVGASALLIYNQQMAAQEAKIAADPPDPDFNKVASTTPPRLKLPTGDGTKAVDRMLRDLTAARILAAAVVTSIDRASGALLAGDTAALEKQNHAAIADAREAEARLNAAVALLPAAIRQLGSAHGRGPRALKSFLVKAKPSLVTDSKDARAIFTSFAAQQIG